MTVDLRHGYNKAFILSISIIFIRNSNIHKKEMSRLSPKRTHAPVLATTTITIRSIGWLLLLLLLSSGMLTTSVQGYASWLQCFIDLDESEVVMNHHIRPASDSDYLVQIEAKLHDGNDDNDWTTSGLAFPADQMSVVALRLKVPSQLQHTTVQYVMETTSAGASFVQAPTKCNGSRSHGNQYDEVVHLQVDGTLATTTQVELVAGWATGHAPVTLTPRLVLTRQQRQPSSSDHENEL